MEVLFKKILKNIDFNVFRQKASNNQKEMIFGKAKIKPGVSYLLSIFQLKKKVINTLYDEEKGNYPCQKFANILIKFQES